MVMARILFSCAEGLGHIDPLLPLASGFSARGHDVVFVVPEPYCRWVPYPSLPRPPGNGGPRALRRTSPWLPPIVAAVRRVRPALVVHDVSEWAALIAARLENIPVVAHANGPMTARRVTEFREGLRAANAIVSRQQEPPKLLVDPCPAFLQHPAICHLGRRISISPLESDWAGENDRRNRDVVYVTVGTGSPDHSPSILCAAVAAVHDLQLPLVVSLGPNLSRQRELIGWLRARAPAAELLEYVDHKHILPRAKLMICHSGSQTLIHAARAATWVLALPSTSDQFHCARALARAGGGVWHHGDKAGATRLRKSIKKLLCLGEEGRYPFHLQAQVMRMPRPADAAEAVEREAWEGAPESFPPGPGH